MVLVRIRNLYQPATLKDYPANTPWTPDGTTATGEKTTDGWKCVVTGTGTGWLYPPTKPDGCTCVCWQKLDGTYYRSSGMNVTAAVTPSDGAVTFTRVCGFTDGNLPGMLYQMGVPFVFAAADHPY